MNKNDIKYYLLDLFGHNQIIFNQMISLINNLLNNNIDKPIIHIYGKAENNKLLLINLMELLMLPDETIHLNDLMLYNNISSWYKDSIKLCFVNNCNPNYFHNNQTSIINLATENVMCGVNYKTSKVVKPSLKFIIISNYDPIYFTEKFNDNTIHINFNMNEINETECNNLYNIFKNNKNDILTFIYKYKI